MQDCFWCISLNILLDGYSNLVTVFFTLEKCDPSLLWTVSDSSNSPILTLRLVQLSWQFREVKQIKVNLVSEMWKKCKNAIGRSSFAISHNNFLASGNWGRKIEWMKSIKRSRRCRAIWKGGKLYNQIGEICKKSFRENFSHIAISDVNCEGWKMQFNKDFRQNISYIPMVVVLVSKLPWEI